MAVEPARDFLHNFPRRVRRVRESFPVAQLRSSNVGRPQRSHDVLSDISGLTTNVQPLVPLAKQACDSLRDSPNEVQICFDFTKGRCNRRNCKFSHDIGAIIRYNSKEQGICFDFLRGECNRGPLCRFSHDLTRVVSQWMVELHDSPHARPPPRGICYDFVRGQCPRGRQCRFSHDLLEIAIATSRANNENVNPQQCGATPKRESLSSDFGSLENRTQDYCGRMALEQSNAWSTISRCINNGISPGSLTHSAAPSSEAPTSDDMDSDCFGELQSPSPISSGIKSIWYDEQFAIWSPMCGHDMVPPHDDGDERVYMHTHVLDNIRVRRLLGGQLCDVIGLPRLKNLSHLPQR